MTSLTKVISKTPFIIRLFLFVALAPLVCFFYISNTSYVFVKCIVINAYITAASSKYIIFMNSNRSGNISSIKYQNEPRFSVELLTIKILYEF
jgi:hypothetical protein